MNAEQILALYETNGLDVDEIVAATGMEIEVVRGFLRGASALYRARVERGAEADVTRDEATEMIQVVKEIARDKTKAPRDRLRAAIYARDEHFGRNDAKSRALGGTMVQNNFVTINNRLREIKELRQQRIRARAREAIEIETNEVNTRNSTARAERA